MSESESERARERLSALENNRDGFKLAEIDLQMRHEGDHLRHHPKRRPDHAPHRQRVSTQDLMALARQEAAAILDADPDLTRPEARRHRGRT